MYTLQQLLSIALICFVAGFVACLVICKRICNGCLKSTFERERKTDEMYADALRRMSGDQRNHNRCDK